MEKNVPETVGRPRRKATEAVFLEATARQNSAARKKLAETTQQSLISPHNIEGINFLTAARNKDLPHENLLSRFDNAQQPAKANGATKKPTKKPAAASDDTILRYVQPGGNGVGNSDDDDNRSVTSTFAETIDGVKRIILDGARKAGKAAETAAKKLQTAATEASIAGAKHAAKAAKAAAIAVNEILQEDLPDATRVAVHALMIKTQHAAKILEQAIPPAEEPTTAAAPPSPHTPATDNGHATNNPPARDKTAVEKYRETYKPLINAVALVLAVAVIAYLYYNKHTAKLLGGNDNSNHLGK